MWLKARFVHFRVRMLLIWAAPSSGQSSYKTRHTTTLEAPLTIPILLLPILSR